MMDTILNLGLNDDTVQGLAKDFGERFALVRYTYSYPMQLNLTHLTNNTHTLHIYYI